MAAIKRITVTLPADMVAVVRNAVEDGGYASNSEVVREALHDWRTKRALRPQELDALKADIGRGLADLAEGRVSGFDAERVIAQGRTVLTGRLRSA